MLQTIQCRRLLFLLLGLASLLPIHARESVNPRPEATPPPANTSVNLTPYQPLLEDSPFLTPEFRERISKSRSAGTRDYVFHGYIKLDDQWLFCIYNRKQDLAHWLKLNDTLDGYTLTQFNQDANTVEFSQGSLKFYLTLDQPK